MMDDIYFCLRDHAIMRQINSWLASRKSLDSTLNRN